MEKRKQAMSFDSTEHQSYCEKVTGTNAGAIYTKILNYIQIIKLELLFRLKTELLLLIALFKIYKKAWNKQLGNLFTHLLLLLQISRMSTSYYSLIPLEGYAYNVIPPLNSQSDIRNQMRLIHTLLDLETASKMMLGSQLRINGMSSTRYLFLSIIA